MSPDSGIGELPTLGWDSTESSCGGGCPPAVEDAPRRRRRNREKGDMKVWRGARGEGEDEDMGGIIS